MSHHDDTQPEHQPTAPDEEMSTGMESEAPSEGSGSYAGDFPQPTSDSSDEDLDNSGGGVGSFEDNEGDPDNSGGGSV